jgi:hypothetical protein
MGNTFSVSTLKNRVAGYDPAVAAQMARIAKTGKLPETTRPQDEMLVCKNRVGMLAFFQKIVDEQAQGEVPEVFGWYASQSPDTHAPFLLAGPFRFCAPDNKGNLSVSAMVDGRRVPILLTGLGVVARANARYAEYLSLVKAWGITESEHRTRFEAHAAARKAAADSVAIAGAAMMSGKPDATVIRAASTPTEGRVNDGVIQAKPMDDSESSLGSLIELVNHAALDAGTTPAGIVAKMREIATN